MLDTLKCLLDNFEDISLPSSSNIGYKKLIWIDTGTDPDLPPLASKLYTFPPKHQEWVRRN